MLLVVDNGSVYTGNIAESLAEAGVAHRRVPFDGISPSDIESADSVVLSGRRRNDPLMNATNSRMVRYCLGSGIPLLGICYGAEILAITLGGTIRRMDGPRHGLHEARTVLDNPICRGTISVFESHSYMMASLGPDLEVIASSGQCRAEAVRHRGEKIFGTQFHPEMSRDGREVLRNFASIR